MRKCRGYLFFVLGILLICTLAPLSVHAADEGVSIWNLPSRKPLRSTKFQRGWKP